MSVGALRLDRREPTLDEIHAHDLGTARSVARVILQEGKTTYLGVELNRHLRVLDPDHGVVELSR